MIEKKEKIDFVSVVYFVVLYENCMKIFMWFFNDYFVSVILMEIYVDIIVMDILWDWNNLGYF